MFRNFCMSIRLRKRSGGAVAGLAGSQLVASSHVWNVRAQARGGLGEAIRAREPEIRTRQKTQRGNTMLNV